MRLHQSLSVPEQLALLQTARSQTSSIELVFHGTDLGHALTTEFESLRLDRLTQFGTRLGYTRPHRKAVLHRYPYDRRIVARIVELGGFFAEATRRNRGDVVHFTDLGDVDVTFLNSHDAILFSTVTHEGIVFVSAKCPINRI